MRVELEETTDRARALAAKCFQLYLKRNHPQDMIPKITTLLTQACNDLDRLKAKATNDSEEKKDGE